MTRVKICGIKEEVHALVAAEAGADLIGLVFAPSQRQLTPAQAEKIAAAVKQSGHATEVVNVVQQKVPGTLNTASGIVEGEKSLWAERAESLTMENTREVYPGLFVAGMAGNATFGGPRMGPIFGGMLLSGEKAAAEISEKLNGK